MNGSNNDVEGTSSSSLYIAARLGEDANSKPEAADAFTWNPREIGESVIQGLFRVSVESTGELRGPQKHSVQSQRFDGLCSLQAEKKF